MASIKGIVQFDYDAEAPDELTLRVGDVINNVKNVEEGWCQGSLGDKVGMFPDNFVKLIEEPTPKAAAKTKHKEVLRKVKATFEYEPVNADELRLAIGDIVEVYRDEEEGWAFGGLNGKEGCFPTNFTTVHQPEAHMDEPPHKPEETQAAKKVKGVGFGNIFGDGPIKLRSSFVDGDGGSGKISAATRQGKMEKSQAKAEVPKVEKSEKLPKQSEKSAPIVPPAAKKPSPPTLEKCRVMFDYPAENDDELTLVKGEIVMILDKTGQDVGWWEGEIVDDNGKKRRGVFPDNFVAPLPAVDDDLSSEDTSSKDSIDGKTDSKPSKSKAVVEQGNHQDGKSENLKFKSSELTSKLNSLKRPAPVPPASTNSSKSASVNNAEPDFIPSQEEPKLTHYKRANGPKNRRKPDSAGRRERAKESATDEMPAALDSPVENEQGEEPTEPTPPPKKDSKRGVQVMPSLRSDAQPGDKPAWLTNLKNRGSQKKPQTALAVSPNKEEEPPTETPNWRNNLKKRNQPLHPPAQPTSPKPVTSPMAPKHLTSPQNHASPTPVKDDEPHHWKSTRTKPEPDLHQNETDSTDSKPKPTEVKKPMKPFQIPHKPSDTSLKKTPVNPAKPKPPPPKSKPLVPPSKPVVATGAIEELREELRLLKDAFNVMQVEHRREVARISQALDEEKRHRILLQDEVASLQKHG